MVYVGIDGPDFGKAKVTNLANWGADFRAVEPPPEPEPEPPGKVWRPKEGPGY